MRLKFCKALVKRYVISYYPIFPVQIDGSKSEHVTIVHLPACYYNATRTSEINSFEQIQHLRSNVQTEKRRLHGTANVVLIWIACEQVSF